MVPARAVSSAQCRNLPRFLRTVTTRGTAKYLLAVALFPLASGAWAACNVVAGVQYIADAGSTCTYTATTPTEVMFTNTTLPGDGISVQNGASLALDATSAAGAEFKVVVSGATRNAISVVGSGSGPTVLTSTLALTPRLQGGNGASAFYLDADAEVTVDAQNIWAHVENASTASFGIKNDGGRLVSTGKIIARVSADSTSSVAMQLDGITEAGKGLTATNDGAGAGSVALVNTGTTTVGGFLGVTAINADNLGIAIRQTDGSLIQTEQFELAEIVGGLHAIEISKGLLSAGTSEITASVEDVTVGLGFTALVEAREGNALYMIGAGNQFASIEGSLTGGTMGAAIETANAAGSRATINIISDAKVKAASGAAYVDGAGDAVVTIFAQAQVEGKLTFGDGSDQLILDKFKNVSKITLLDFGDDLSDGDGWVDELTLRNNSTAMVISGDIIQNAEIVRVETGEVNFSNAQLTTGKTDGLGLIIDTDGIVSTGLSFNLDGNLSVLAAGQLLSNKQNGSVFTVMGDAKNAGTINLRNGFAGDRLVINGDYIGQGGVILMDTAAADDASASDLVQIGKKASGSTILDIANAGGLGAETQNNGIRVVEVLGTSAADAFTLKDGMVTAGAFEYRLFFKAKDGGDQHWYLRSEVDDPVDPEPPIDPPTPPDPPIDPPTPPVDPKPPTITYRPEVPLFSALANQFRQADLTMLSNLHRRMGETPEASDHLAWARVIRSSFDTDVDSSLNLKTESDLTGLQLGADVWRTDDWRMGVYAGVLDGTADVTGFASGVVGYVGTADTRSVYLGAYGTMTREDGTYVDLVAQASDHSADVLSHRNRRSNQDGKAFTVSVEAGRPYDVPNSTWTVEGQGQLIYHNMSLDSAQLWERTVVHHSNDDAFVARAGLRAAGEYAFSGGTLFPYLRANVIHQLSGDDSVNFAIGRYNVPFSTPFGGTSAEFSVGGTYGIAEKGELYGEIGRSWSVDGPADLVVNVHANIGARFTW